VETGAAGKSYAIKTIIPLSANPAPGSNPDSGT
jgi:hypothetical protein